MVVVIFLQHDTKYYYQVGIGQNPRTFWFMTPPKVGPDVPYTFGVIGKFLLESSIRSHYSRPPSMSREVSWSVC